MLVSLPPDKALGAAGAAAAPEQNETQRLSTVQVKKFSDVRIRIVRNLSGITGGIRLEWSMLQLRNAGNRAEWADIAPGSGVARAERHPSAYANRMKRSLQHVQTKKSSPGLNPQINLVLKSSLLNSVLK